MKENKIIQGNCLDVLKTLEDESVDLTVTSPPYDNLRDYEGNNSTWNEDLWRGVIKELYRLTKDGGVVVWVTQDQTKNFRKSGTSFKMALCFIESGFGLFETCIYRKYGAEGAWWNKRFRVDHEYIMIFFKGERPKYFNKEHLKIPSKHGGKVMRGGASRKKDGTTMKSRSMTINKMKCRGTIWEYLNGGDKDKVKRLHPATFPDQLAKDAINCFSKEGDVVLDPFLGSGTTAVACILLGRKYIGIELNPSYIEIAKKRIENIPPKLF